MSAPVNTPPPHGGLPQGASGEQRRAADPGRSVFVTANAGSGKTSTLVDRVARLLLAQVPPSRILCVTYTKAAAAEMQSRLFKRLGQWAVADDVALRAQLAALDGRDPAALTEADLSDARRLFARALETPGGLKIQTIHAFCERLLRRFPLEAGVAPGFELLDDAAAAELSRAARDQLAVSAARDGDGRLGRAYARFVTTLDWESFQSFLAALETHRRSLTRYVDAIAEGRAPAPAAVLGVEPGLTAEAVEAYLIARIDAREWRLATEGMRSGSKTDQDAADRMAAFDPEAGPMEALHPLFFTSEGKPRAKLGTKSAPPAAVALLEDVLTLYLPALERLRALRVVADLIDVLTLAKTHEALYETEKRKSGGLDFADLIEKTRGLLTHSADAAWALYKLDGGLEHILIDEAQDTAPEQWDIMRALAEEFFAGAGRDRPDAPRTVFAVGDEKQSIYSFQGARPERLRRESRRYAGLIGDAFIAASLDVSFRSTPEVLDFVDRVFDGPEPARALVGDDGDLTAHRAHRQGQAGTVDLVPLFSDPETAERETWDAPVDQEAADSGRKQLATRLARDIRAQVEGGVAVHDRDGRLRPCGHGDFLVLVRRRDATFEEIIRALKREGVPVAGADRLTLSEHIGFADLLSLARFALYPGDELSLAEILRGPFCDVEEEGPGGLYDLAGIEGRRPLWRELQARAHEHPAWMRARALADFLIAARGRDPFAFFSGVLNRVDDAGLSGRARMTARLGREAAEAIDETLNQIIAAEARGGVDLETCLARLEAADVEVKRELEGPRGEVRVMTVHGAKGLEAPVVILPDTTARAKVSRKASGLIAVATGEGDDPDAEESWLAAPARKEDDCAAIAAARAERERRVEEESLRLLYVALTRARDRLVIMGRVSARAKGRPEDRSWYARIAAVFEQAVDDGQARELADGTLRLGVDPATVAPAAAEAAEAAVPLPDWVSAPPSPDAAARYVSPSHLDAGAARPPAVSPLSGRDGDGQARLGRFRRGALIHRLLEKLPDIAPADRGRAAERLLAHEPGLDDARRAEMIAAALGVIEDPAFAPVFAPGSRAEAAFSGHAPELPAGVAVAGRIDRLVVTADRVLVVDFKTNRPAPGHIEDADPGYIRQMGAYVAVLRRLHPKHEVEAALVWTDGPRLMPVPQGLMDQALTDAAR